MRNDRHDLLGNAKNINGFPDQAMTLTAIDRLVHRATILEMKSWSDFRRT